MLPVQWATESRETAPLLQALDSGCSTPSYDPFPSSNRTLHSVQFISTQF